MDVLEAIKSRRSIRQYEATPVDDKTLEIVLQAARWAPSWANTQCWRFIVVRDSTLKDKLAGILKVGRPDGKNAATEGVRNAPVVIVACAEKGKSGFYHGEPSTDKGDYWYMYDVGLAMENLVLAAHSSGLGTVHVGLFDAREAANILGVPEGFCVVAITPLGFPAHEGNPPRRKELYEIIFYDKYGTLKEGISGE